MRLKKNIISIFAILSAMSMHAHQQEPWTWLYRKVFSAAELKEHQEKKVCVYQHEDIHSFTQLVFSWNGFRPEKGYCSFWVQERDAATKRWGSWHKMFDWGKDVQRSYTSYGDGRSTYRHVRLEIEGGKHSDAFRISIAAKNGADLSQIKAVSVAISDVDKFVSEIGDKQLAKLSSVYIDNVPSWSQMVLDHPRNKHLCSPTSCAMLVSFLQHSVIDPVDFAQNVYDEGLDTYGSWPFNMVHAFERSYGNALFAMARFNSFSGLHKRLQKGIPVVVSVRGHIRGAAKPFPHGHLLVVVGFDAQRKKVICHDPAFASDSQVEVKYALRDFLSAWENSRRLAYLAYPSERALSSTHDV